MVKKEEEEEKKKEKEEEEEKQQQQLFGITSLLQLVSSYLVTYRTICHLVNDPYLLRGMCILSLSDVLGVYLLSPFIFQHCKAEISYWFLVLLLLLLLLLKVAAEMYFYMLLFLPKVCEICFPYFSALMLSTNNYYVFGELTLLSSYHSLCLLWPFVT